MPAAKSETRLNFRKITNKNATEIGKIIQISVSAKFPSISLREVRKPKISVAQRARLSERISLPIPKWQQLLPELQTVCNQS